MGKKSYLRKVKLLWNSDFSPRPQSYTGTWWCGLWAFWLYSRPTHEAKEIWPQVNIYSLALQTNGNPGCRMFTMCSSPDQKCKPGKISSPRTLRPRSLLILHCFVEHGNEKQAEGRQYDSCRSGTSKNCPFSTDCSLNGDHIKTRYPEGS